LRPPRLVGTVFRGSEAVRSGRLTRHQLHSSAWRKYDGVWHGEVQHVGRDRRPLNRLNDAGWTVVFVTAADLHRPELLLARIARLLVSRPRAR